MQTQNLFRLIEETTPLEVADTKILLCSEKLKAHLINMRALNANQPDDTSLFLDELIKSVEIRQECHFYYDKHRAKVEGGRRSNYLTLIDSSVPQLPYFSGHEDFI